MPDFTFQPGMLAAVQTWNIVGTELTGPQTALSLKDVDDCTFDYVVQKNRALMVLVLHSGTDKVKISCNGVLGSADRGNYLLLVREVMFTFDRYDVEVFVRSPGQDVMAWAFAGMGVLSGLWGLYYAIPSAMDGNNFGLGMGVFFVLLGAFMAWAGSPWTPNPPKSPADALEWVQRLLAL